MTFESDYDAVLVTTARRARLDIQIETMAADSEFTPVVRRLWCLRGISTLTAFALAVEIGDWHRFTGSTIGSFVGLVPSEYSSGSSRAQGPITKTGNGHARRLLVEAAWHHRPRYQPGKTIRDRWDIGLTSRTSPRRPGKPPPARPLGQVHRPQEEGHRGQHRHRPRARRLVLVAGPARGVTTTTPSSATVADGSARSQPAKLL